VNRGTPDHRIYAQWHFRTRARERLGILLSRHELRAIAGELACASWRNGCRIFNRDRMWFFFPVRGVFCWVLFDPGMRRVVTCLAEAPDYFSVEETAYYENRGRMAFEKESRK